VANVLTAEVVLIVLVALAVALMVLLTVLIIDESIYYISPFGSALSILHQYWVSTIDNMSR
jgi:hypothetical protein